MSSSFASLSLSPSLLAVIGELGYEHMTPVQAQSIPVLLSGRDLIAQSNTGSGKTVAFAAPILEKLTMTTRSIQALVLCPTRELCAQVARELRKLGRRHAGLHVLVVSGGEPGRPQRAALERGVHVVVGTPGRVLDMLGRGVMDLSQVHSVVLDEADRMLDMGFEAEMDKILRALPEYRQMALFSATFPASIAAISGAHQRDAVRVTIDETEASKPQIRHIVVTAKPDEKLDALYAVLERYPHESALIFCNFKATVAQLERSLARAGASVDCLHGDLEQFDRNQVMAMFRNHSVRLLIATDVVARGIDVPELELVINYELPTKPDVYVHRTGRTGRAGRTGLAVSLATSRERARLGAIERVADAHFEHVTLELAEGRLPASVRREAAMDTISISGGRKQKVRPGDILGALTGEAGGLSAADVGKIEIHERLSYVAVSRAVSQRAAESLDAGRIKGKRFRASRLGQR